MAMEKQISVGDIRRKNAASQAARAQEQRGSTPNTQQKTGR